MHPKLLDYPSLFILWGLAILVGIVGAVLLARMEHFRLRTSLALILLLGFFFVLGTKIHAFGASPWPFGTGGVYQTIMRGFHFPGGLILVALVSPVLFRAFRISALHFIDSIIPMVGISIAIARMGCFLNGCCFGVACDLPWAVSFPPGSRAFSSLAEVAGLTADRSMTIPLHPLQIYFALAGVGMAGVLFWMRKRKAYNGQLTLWFLVMWGWSKVAIESLRDASLLPVTPHLWKFGLVLALLSTVVLIVTTLLQARRGRRSETAVADGGDL